VQRTNVNRTTVEKMAAEGLLEGMPASDQIDMFEVIAEPVSRTPKCEQKTEDEERNVTQASRLEKPGGQKTEDGGQKPEEVSRTSKCEPKPKTEPEIQKELQEPEDQGFLF